MKGLLLATILSVSALCAQDWVPTRIVAITDYVPLARMARVSGDVVVKCSLDKDGTVVMAEVISGHSLLKEQARRNALLWNFHRTDPSGATRHETVTLIYQYRLEGLPVEHAITKFSFEFPNVIRVVAPFIKVETIAD